MSKANPSHRANAWLCGGVFLAYGLAVYFGLYRSQGLQALQINFHFFSNVLGSLSQRLLSELLPLGLLTAGIAFSPRKWLKAVLIACFLGTLIINLGGIGYYFFAKSPLQWYVLKATRPSLLWGIAPPAGKAALFALAGIAAFLAWRLWKMQSSWLQLASRRRKSLMGGLVLLAGSQAYWLGAFHHDHVSLFANDTRSKKMVRLSELENSAMQSIGSEIWQTLSPIPVEKKPLSPEEEAAVEQGLLDKQFSGSLNPPFKKIVLIVAESLNQDFLSHYNPQIKGSSPFLDQLLENQTHLDEFYPSGPFTLHGLQAMLCGHTHLENGLRNIGHECMPKLISRAGYRTEFIRGFTKYYLGENLHFSKFGFQSITAKEELEEEFPEFASQRPDLAKGWGFSDDYVFNEALERLRSAKPEDKLFLSLLTVDTHTPGGRCYQPDPTFSVEPNHPVLESVRCLDEALKHFISAIQEEGLLDEDTLIVLTADQLFPNYTGLPGDQFKISFRLPPGRIPLIMLSGRRLELAASQGSQVDLASSILDSASQPIPPYYLGKSLFSHPSPAPMGQEREYGYVIFQNRFHSFSLAPGKEEAHKPQEGPMGLYLQIPKNSHGELLKRVEMAKKERARPSDSSLIYKWYFNRYHRNELAE